MQQGSRIHKSHATLPSRMCYGVKIGFGLVVRCNGDTQRDPKKKKRLIFKTILRLNLKFIDLDRALELVSNLEINTVDSHWPHKNPSIEFNY